MMAKTLGVPAATMAVLLLSACQTQQKPANEADSKPPIPVKAVPVRMFTPQNGERYSASLIPAKQIALSFRLAGFVESVYGGSKRLEAGDLIPAGTVLATLRPKDYDIQVQQARGQLDAARKSIEVAKAMVVEAEAGATRAEAAWKRVNALYESRAVTAPDWEGAKAQRDVAVAQLGSARSQVEAATAQERSAAANVSSAELAKVDTTLIAPYTARLLQRSVEVGSLVSPGLPAFTLADTGSVKAVFGVPDSSVAGLRLGNRLPMLVETAQGQFTGVITSIAAAADPATRLFLIEATVPNANGALRPGMIATVTLRSSGPSQPVSVVPLSAIVRSKTEGAGFSLMVVRGGRARTQNVTLAMTYGDQISVAGVQPGELVISSGASLLAEGERVEVIQ